MVYFYKIEQDNKEYLAYMGKDKFENEILIEYSWDEDIWFHVDNLSSAHVYIRLPSKLDIKNIPPLVLEQLAQLCKANSIKGCKMNDVRIVYTPTRNLKTKGMETGQVGFHDEKQLYYTIVPKKNNEILNKLKNRIEKDKQVFINMRLERLKYLRKKEKT